MIKVALVRGKYLNNFEAQNFYLDKKRFKLVGISTSNPLHKNFQFPIIKFSSLVDLDYFGNGLKYLTNRIIGDSQVLFGLEEMADDFDIFHTADPHYYYSYQLAKLRARGKIKCLISTFWETIPFNNESVKKKKEIKDFTKKYVDLFICYTDRAKEALVIEGVEERKIEVVRLGVDISKFNIANYELRIKKEITILFVGRLIEEKGVLDLLKAFENVKLQMTNDKSNPNIKLIIIGNGPLKRKIPEDIKVEEKNYEEMPRVYQEADIFVMPSKTSKTWEEQYGMVLIEAMASGLPIVAYHSGSIPELIYDCGILVPAGNIELLAESLVKLIKDKNQRWKLAKMGRYRAEKVFDSKNTEKAFERVYTRLIKKI